MLSKIPTPKVNLRFPRLRQRVSAEALKELEIKKPLRYDLGTIKENLEISKAHLLKYEIGWRARDLKFETKRLYDGYSKRIVDRYIDKEATRALRHIKKLEIERRNYDPIREQAIQDKLMADSMRIAEQTRKRMIKKEFRGQRLYRQPYEGEWGIESGLRTFRKAQRPKYYDPIREAYAREQEKHMLQKQLERKDIRIRREEREMIKNRPRVIKVVKDISRHKIEEPHMIKVERESKIIEWKPPKEDIKGNIKEIQSGGTKQLVKVKEEAKPLLKETEQVQKTKQIQRLKQKSELLSGVLSRLSHKETLKLMPREKVIPKLDTKQIITSQLKIPEEPVTRQRFRPKPVIIPKIKGKSASKKLSVISKRVSIKKGKPRMSLRWLGARYQRKRVGLSDAVLASTAGRKTLKSAGFFRVGKKKPKRLVL